MWTPSLQAFRRLAVIAGVLHALYAADYLWSILPLPAEGDAAFQWGGVGAMVPLDRAQRLWYVANGTLIVSLFAMSRLHDWSHWTGLIAAIVLCLSPPVFGINVTAPLHALIYGVEWSIIDLTLAIAFLTPIALRFNGDVVDAPVRTEEEVGP